MPREQLLGLAGDVDRLLAAGVAAAGSDALRRRAGTLRELGKKVPALAPVAEAAERVTVADKPGPSFLDLLVMTRQVRASLAAAGAEGTLTPLPPSGPWRTAVPVRDLQPVYDALTESGSGREECIKDAAHRKLFGDLRLLTALFEALGDAYAPVADAVADQGLPSLGAGLLAELREGLSLEGKAIDARRLRAICRIDRKAGAELCRKALAEGNITLRAEALIRLPEVAGADEAERAALQYCREKSRDVRAAALTALRAGASEAALEALFAAMDDKDDGVRRVAVESLGSVRTPGATGRLLALLQESLPAANASIRAKKKAKAGKAAVTRLARHLAEQDEAQRKPLFALEALGQRKDGDPGAVAGAILPLLRSDDPTQCLAAVDALCSLGPFSDEVVPALVDALGEAKGLVAVYAVSVLRTFPAAARQAAVPALIRFIESRKGNDQDRIIALEVVAEHLDRHGEAVQRAARLLLADRGIRNAIGMSGIFAALEKMGPAARSLLPDLFEAFHAPPERHFYGIGDGGGAVAALDPEGKESIPVLIGMLADKKPSTQVRALQSLAGYGPIARAAVPDVERLTASKDHLVSHHAKQTLEAIR